MTCTPNSAYYPAIIIILNTGPRAPFNGTRDQFDTGARYLISYNFSSTWTTAGPNRSHIRGQRYWLGCGGEFFQRTVLAAMFHLPHLTHARCTAFTATSAYSASSDLYPKFCLYPAFIIILNTGLRAPFNGTRDQFDTGARYL